MAKKKKRSKRRAKARRRRQRLHRPQLRGPSPIKELERRLREEPEAFILSILRDSAKLRQEPEFQDLRFDKALVAEVMEDAFRRYQKRLEQAEQEGEKALADVWAEMEEEIIEALTPPAFRRDFLEQLDRLAERLRRAGEREKLASTLLLSTILKIEGMPWSVCGLVYAIYREAQEQLFQEIAEEEALMRTLLEGVEAEDFEAVWATLEEPERKAAAEAFLRRHPDMRKRLEKEMDRKIDEAVEAIKEGKLKLDLFRDEELLRGMAYLAIYEEQFSISQELTEAEANAVAARFFKLIQRAIAEVMTPTRVAEMEAHLKGILRELWKAKDKQTLLIQAVTASLEAWEHYEDNPVLIAEYIRQSRELFERPESTDPGLEAKLKELIEEIKRAGGIEGAEVEGGPDA